MEKKGKSVYEKLLEKHKDVVKENKFLKTRNWYYENRCKELEAERKQLKRDIAQLGMLLGIEIDKINRGTKDE